MSIPSAEWRPDDTAPSIRGAAGFVCPTCKTRFDTASDAHPKCPHDGAPLVLIRDFVDADGDTMLGRTLGGRFTLLARLGAGSMGTVYRARQHPVGRDVAVKILRSDRAIDEASRARFLREARANSLLASPNTVTMFDFGQGENGDFFLAMELLEGESLGQRLKRMGRIAPDIAVETARQALRSLSEAHSKGVIHRDLKPDNLFYARMPDGGPNDEVVKILDFGIAKMLRDPSEPFNAVETQAGTVFGTPRYMSPEQAQAKPLDARSDLYSLGVILYHMLTGRPPYLDDDAIVVMARHIKSPPRPFAEVAPDAHVPPALERVVMRALAKEPSGRPENADAMANELSASLEASPNSSGGMRVPSKVRRLSTPPMGVQVGSLSSLSVSVRDTPIVRTETAIELQDVDDTATITGHLRRARAARAMLALALVVIAASLVLLAVTRPRSTSAAASSDAPTKPAPTAIAPSVRPAEARATTLATAAAASVPVENLPVVASGVTHERPRASALPSRVVKPPQAASSAPHAAKSAAPASSTSNYGLFE